MGERRQVNKSGREAGENGLRALHFQTTVPIVTLTKRGREGEREGGREREYNRKFKCLLGSCSYTNTHMPIVVV